MLEKSDSGSHGTLEQYRWGEKTSITDGMRTIELQRTCRDGIRTIELEFEVRRNDPQTGFKFWHKVNPELGTLHSDNNMCVGVATEEELRVAREELGYELPEEVATTNSESLV